MSAIRRIGRGFSSAAGILLFLWLIRSFIGLSPYNLELAEGFLLFALLARLARTETRRGVITAVASLFGKLAGFFIITWLFLIIGGALFGLTATLTAYTTQALLAAILTGITAIILNNLRRGEEVKLTGTPVLAPPEPIVSDSNIKAELTRDSILLPIRRRGRTYGYIGHGEIAVTLNTRIGEIKRTINGAFALTGVGERGLTSLRSNRAARDTDAQNFGYKDIAAFLERSQGVYESIHSRLRFNRVGFWPFVQVEESPEGQHVRVPFVDVERTPAGERVSIAGIVVSDEDRGRVGVGPISIDSGGERRRRRFGFGWYTILGFNGEKIRIEAQGRRVEMHSEEYLLTVDQDSTSLRRGGYSIALSENYASFNTPTIRAEVSQDGWATFRAPETYCRVSGERITIESHGAEKRSLNRETGLSLYKKIADLVSEASAAITQDERVDESQAEAFAKQLREMMTGI